MRRIAILLASLGLAACGGEEHQDLRQWMKESTKDFKGKVPPLPPIKKFPVVAYETGDLLDPFNTSKIEPERKAGSGGLKPDLDRRKEPLESYPLESLKMVGTLIKGKMVHALIQADKNLHQVKIGNYMGQNDGRITAIHEDRIEMVELVPDGAGGWLERQAKIALEDN